MTKSSVFLYTANIIYDRMWRFGELINIGFLQFDKANASQQREVDFEAGFDVVEEWKGNYFLSLAFSIGVKKISYNADSPSYNQSFCRLWSTERVVTAGAGKAPRYDIKVFTPSEDYNKL